MLNLLTACVGWFSVCVRVVIVFISVGHTLLVKFYKWLTCANPFESEQHTDAASSGKRVTFVLSLGSLMMIRKFVIPTENTSR